MILFCLLCSQYVIQQNSRVNIFNKLQQKIESDFTKITKRHWNNGAIRANTERRTLQCRILHINASWTSFCRFSLVREEFQQPSSRNLASNSQFANYQNSPLTMYGIKMLPLINESQYPKCNISNLKISFSVK